MHLCMVWSTWVPSLAEAKHYSTLNWVMHSKCANRLIFDFYLGQMCVEALSGILLVGWYSWFLVSSNWFLPELLTSNANISTSAAVLAFDDEFGLKLKKPKIICRSSCCLCGQIIFKQNRELCSESCGTISHADHYDSQWTLYWRFWWDKCSYSSCIRSHGSSPAGKVHIST